MRKQKRRSGTRTATKAVEAPPKTNPDLPGPTSVEPISVNFTPGIAEAQRLQINQAKLEAALNGVIISEAQSRQRAEVAEGVANMFFKSRIKALHTITSL